MHPLLHLSRYYLKVVVARLLSPYINSVAPYYVSVAPLIVIIVPL